MWVEKRQSSWIETVVLGGFALPHIWTRTLTVTVLSILATVLYEEVPQFHYSLTVAPFTIIGLPLGIFLGFRNNSAYDRFWEGRKLWGALVNTSRSFTRQILTLLDSPDGMEQLRDFQRETVHLLIAYVHALRLHLRDAKPGQVLDGSLPVEEHASHEGEHNVPLGILQTLAERLATARRKGWVHPQHVLVLEASLIGITDIQGACERIRSTPIPYSYTVLIHRIVAVYCMLLPFGLMETVKWATPAVVLAISYCFFGLDAVGDELEDPFGTQANDLPLDAISRTIERDLRRRLGEVVPGPIEPKRGVLT
jgi:putative membrane protein